MISLLKRSAAALCILAWMNAGAVAQPPTPPGETPSPPADPPIAESETASTGTATGDVITLKNGREIRGFKVLHQTTTEVVIRLSDGIELRLPRNMVTSVAYNNRGDAENDESDASALTRELRGVKLAPALNRRLQEPVAASGPREIRDTDYIEEIVDLSQQAGVPLAVSEAVRAIPVRERAWTTTIEPGLSFFSILHDDLLPKFPKLAVEYKFDQVVLTTQETIAAQAPQPDPEAATPPSEGSEGAPPPATPPTQEAGENQPPEAEEPPTPPGS